MRLDAEVVLDPAGRALSARYRITGHPAGAWWLHDGLRIVSCRVDGLAVEPRRLLAAAPAPFGPRIHPVELPTAGELLELRVEGRIGQLEAGVNCLGPELIELAVYAAWHPVFPSLPRFAYTLDLEVRGEGAVAANGLRGRSGQGRTRWRSMAPGVDIALIWAPSLAEHRSTGSPVVVLAEEVAAQGPLAALVDRALQFCTAWWGPPRGSLDTLTVALSPRDGWFYSRLPLVLLPGRQPLDNAGLRTVLHEVAHLWWSVADLATADDWLNEGPAEYAADRLALALLPAGQRDARLAGVLADLASHAGDPAVLATPFAASDDLRHRNRCLRPALALREVERRGGERAVDDLLTRWHRLGSAATLTTAMALGSADDLLPAEAVDLLRCALTVPGWLPSAAVAE